MVEQLYDFVFTNILRKGLLMNIFEILVVILLSISLLLAIPFGLFEYKVLHKLSPKEQASLSFEKSFTTPSICFFTMLFLTFASFMLFIFASTQGNKGNEHVVRFGNLSIGGLILGVIVGVIYYLKVRKPYLLKHYPEDMEKHKEEARKTRSDYLSWVFVGFFVVFFLDLGALLDIILMYVL